MDDLRTLPPEILAILDESGIPRPMTVRALATSLGRRVGALRQHGRHEEADRVAVAHRRVREWLRGQPR